MTLPKIFPTDNQWRIFCQRLLDTPHPAPERGQEQMDAVALWPAPALKSVEGNDAQAEA